MHRDANYLDSDSTTAVPQRAAAPDPVLPPTGANDVVEDLSGLNQAGLGGRELGREAKEIARSGQVLGPALDGSLGQIGNLAITTGRGPLGSGGFNRAWPATLQQDVSAAESEHGVYVPPPVSPVIPVVALVPYANKGRRKDAQQVMAEAERSASGYLRIMESLADIRALDQGADQHLAVRQDAGKWSMGCEVYHSYDRSGQQQLDLRMVRRGMVPVELMKVYGVAPVHQVWSVAGPDGTRSDKISQAVEMRSPGVIPAVVVEQVAGTSYEKVLHGMRVATLREILEVASGVAMRAADLSYRGVVNLDIKPNNMVASWSSATMALPSTGSLTKGQTPFTDRFDALPQGMATEIKAAYERLPGVKENGPLRNDAMVTVADHEQGLQVRVETSKIAKVTMIDFGEVVPAESLVGATVLNGTWGWTDFRGLDHVASNRIPRGHSLAQTVDKLQTWSIGALVIDGVLTGKTIHSRVPEQDQSFAAAARMNPAEDLQDVREVITTRANPVVAAHLCEVLSRCMDPDLGKRLGSAEAVRQLAGVVAALDESGVVLD
jgi:serine/threonine protein kinase